MARSILGEHLAARELDGLVAALDQALSYVLEEPDGCWDVYSTIDALFAVNLVAAARGRSPPELSVADARWLGDHPAICTEERRMRALACLRRLRQSEKLEKVISDFEDWCTMFDAAAELLTE